MNQKSSLREPDEYEAEYMGGDPEVVHREKMSFPRPFLWLMGILFSFAIVAQIAGLVSSGVGFPAILLPLMGFAFAAMMIAMMATLRVTVSTEKVAVQYGIFGPKIPIEDIVHCEAENYSVMKYGGYGIRYSLLDGSWAYNMLGDKGKAVRIHYRKKSGKIRKLVIASNHHHVLADAINRQRAARGHDVPAHIMPDENELNVDDEVVFSSFEEATDQAEAVEAVEAIQTSKS